MLFLVTLCFVSLLGQTLGVTRQEIYDLIQSDSYDAHEPPPPAGQPTKVKAGLYVNSLAVDKKNQRLVWTIYLRESWNDSRITSLFSKDDKGIIMGKAHWRELWYPDIFFRNSLEVSYEDNPAEQVLLKISQRGLWFVHKLKIATTCYGLHLIGQPAECPVMLESFKYTMDDLVLEFLGSPVDLDSSISIPGHVVVEKTTHDCSQNYTAGAFPCLEIRLMIGIDSNSAAVTAPRLAFAISIFLVMVSWISFWIDGDQVVERFGVLFGSAITLMLLGIGLHVNSDLDLPESNSYIFIGAFVFFVVAAMLEYVIVYGAMQWIPAKLKNRKGELQDNSTPSRINPHVIDIVCGLVVFPALLLAFVIFYAAFHF